MNRFKLNQHWDKRETSFRMKLIFLLAHDIDINDIWFQYILNLKFADRLITRNGTVGLFPVGRRLKKFNATKPETVDHLNATICNAIPEIQPHSLERVVENLSDQMRYCDHMNAEHFLPLTKLYSSFKSRSSCVHTNLSRMSANNTMFSNKFNNHAKSIRLEFKQTFHEPSI